MNAPFQAADFIHHRFTVADVRAIIDTGVLDPDARIELIDGGLIDMPADGPRHNDWTISLGRWLQRNMGDEYAVLPGSTVVLSDDNAPKPDWCVFPADVATVDLRGTDILLAIEQSDTSLIRDLGWKADLYARFGVQDYWVIDLATHVVHVHREPSANGYKSLRRHGRDEPVEVLLIPGLVLRTGTLTRID